MYTYNQSLYIYYKAQSVHSIKTASANRTSPNGIPIEENSHATSRLGRIVIAHKPSGRFGIRLYIYIYTYHQPATKLTCSDDLVRLAFLLPPKNGNEKESLVAHIDRATFAIGNPVSEMCIGRDEYRLQLYGLWMIVRQQFPSINPITVLRFSYSPRQLVTRF